MSARPTAEISLSECKYGDGKIPKLLDVIDVPLLSPAPEHHQTENHIIDKGRWVNRGALPWNQLAELCDRPERLWINSDSTKSGGQYNCMSPDEAATMSDSLFLLTMESLIVEVGSGAWEGETWRTYKCGFDYNQVYHKFNLTDPIALAVFAPKKEGDYPLRDVYICVSLTETYKEDGRCHKLVAAIISDPPL